MTFKIQLPSRFTSLIGRLSHMFPGSKAEEGVVKVVSWPTDAEKVLVAIPKLIVLRNAETRLPVQIEPGGYTAIRQPEGTYGFSYDGHVVNATQQFWSERVDLGFVIVVGQ